MGIFVSSCRMLAIFLIAAFGAHNSFAMETCSESLRSVCQCLYYPVFTIRCSHKNLVGYPDFGSVQAEVQHLDVSFNNLDVLPRNLEQFFGLEVLDVSYNNIQFLPQNVIFPLSLRHLILSFNNISNWIDINPNTLLESAENLDTLNLAGNPLGVVHGNDDRNFILSKSLKTLDVTDCNISKITGPSMWLDGIPNLEHLILRANPLHTLPDMFAYKLLTMDVSACKITTLRPIVFTYMPMLNFVNFSANHRLSLITRNEEYIGSLSLRQIDLSKCNMNLIELKGFPNITSVNLHGNLITELADDSFENNPLIENLDLSSNSISRISDISFNRMRRLRNVDLSLNTIRKIEPDTFANNQQLTSINLSRNFIDRFRHFSSKSLTFLNLSRCEITKIDENAIQDLPELIELDLSYNWFSELPGQLCSPFLQILNLNRCRLSNIENKTFSMLPELSRLNLAGNRLTTVLRKEYFANNSYLNEISLGDNPWRCECDKNSYDFYSYVTEHPSRLKDLSQFQCFFPGEPRGISWDAACEWNPTNRRLSVGEKVWTMTMAILIILAVLYALIFGVKFWSNHHKEMREERQRQENQETSRELMRHNQMVLEQESQLNAPDPRETNPPCYADAILMPKLATSFTSLKLAFMNSTDSENTFRRAAKRARSEEQLNKNGRPILSARTRKHSGQRWIGISADSSASTAGLLPSHSFVTNAQKSFEIIAQLETEDGHSPYAKRKPKANTVSSTRYSSSESLHSRDFAHRDVDFTESPIRCHSEMSFDTTPAHTFFASNESNHSSSSSSSFDYLKLPPIRSHSFQHSDV